MKIAQTKLLLLASVLFVASSCDCLFKKSAKPAEDAAELVANESSFDAENTLVADASEVMPETSEIAAPAAESAPVAEEAAPAPVVTEESAVSATPAEMPAQEAVVAPAAE